MKKFDISCNCPLALTLHAIELNVCVIIINESKGIAVSDYIPLDLCSVYHYYNYHNLNGCLYPIIIVCSVVCF